MPKNIAISMHIIMITHVKKTPIPAIWIAGMVDSMVASTDPNPITIRATALSIHLINGLGNSAFNFAKISEIFILFSFLFLSVGLLFIIVAQTDREIYLDNHSWSMPNNIVTPIDLAVIVQIKKRIPPAIWTSGMVDSIVTSRDISPVATRPAAIRSQFIRVLGNFAFIFAIISEIFIFFFLLGF